MWSTYRGGRFCDEAKVSQSVQLDGTQDGDTQTPDSETSPEEFLDLNNPPKVPYVYREFPDTIYHHGTRRNKVVYSAEERSTYLAQGWRKEPYPADGIPTSELPQKASSVVEAGDTRDASPKPEPARTGRSKREPTADEIADALDGKDAVTWRTVADLLGVGQRQLNNLARAGQLAKTNDGKYTTASVREFLGPQEDTQRDNRVGPVSVRRH